MGTVDKDRLEILSAIKSKLMASIQKEIAGGNVSALELLAILSYAIGECVALQDKNKITVKMAMEVVIKNIEIGNQAAVSGLDNISGLLH